MRRSYNPKSKSFKRSYKKSYATTVPLSKDIKYSVKKAVTRLMETKTQQLLSSSNNIFQSMTNTEVYSLLPIVQQGVTQQNRVGNRIQPVKLTVKGSIIATHLNASYPGASSSYFDLYVFKSKAANQGGIAPTAGDMNLFLQQGSGGDSYNGQALDGLKPVNNDFFTLLAKRRYTLNNIYNTGIGIMTGYYQSTSPQQTFSIDLSKHLKQSWIYNDSSSNVINDNFYIAIGSTQTDGTSVGASVTGTYQFIVDLKYKDA